MDYKVYEYGQITKFEAGVFYKNYKNGNVEALQEFATTLYNEAKAYIGYAKERYSRDYIFYDRVYKLTELLLEEKFEEAQEIINKLQDNLISNSGKKSLFYKYKQEMRG